MSTRNPRLEWALYLAGRGWPVFPLVPGGKQPVIHDWENRATTDPDAIAFWDKHYQHNIGLATGRADLVVVDLDIARPDRTPPADERGRGVTSGAQVLARLAQQAGRTIPDTWTVFTPSGGTHLYFRQPAGHTLRNTAGTLGWLIDTRGHGGYVVAPGSTTMDGGGWELVVDTDPVELPAWLAHLLVNRPATAISAPRTIAPANRTAWLNAALDGETKRIRTAMSGGHNKAQAIAAYNIGRLVGGNHLTRDEAHRALSSAVADHITGPCHCTERKVMGVIDWGLDNGARNPRHLNQDAA